MNIVVAEDDGGTRSLIKFALEEDNHTIIEAHDGRHALKLVRAQKPHMIISDLKMPNMNGDQLLQKVRGLGIDFEIIPFLLLSANNDEIEIIERLNNGADGYFTKPINFPLMRAQVNSLLSSSLRHSNFVMQKLDEIARMLLLSSKYSLNINDHVSDSVTDYLNNIESSVTELLLADHPGGQPDVFTAIDTLTQSIKQPLAYIRFCIGEIDRRRRLVTSMNSETLTWWLIFTVAEAQYAEQPLFVSDLYFSTPSAKTTINTRISMLVEKKILIKQTHSTDGRRQNIRLANGFRDSFAKHINESIGVLQSFLP